MRIELFRLTSIRPERRDGGSLNPSFTRQIIADAFRVCSNVSPSAERALTLEIKFDQARFIFSSASWV